MSKKIGVIGSGSWGTAIALLLAKRGYGVNLWSFSKEEYERLKTHRENKKFLPGVPFPNNIFCTNSLEEAVSGSDLVFMVTPSAFIKTTAENLCPYMKKGTIIVNASKGLEQDTKKTLSVTIKEAIPQAEVAVMSGPSHAEEVARELPTTNVIAARTLEISEYVQDVLMCDVFRVYTSMDVIGVELGGALKNVIALCAGMSDGLGLGDNTKAALMTRGMAEIARLGVAAGADVTTFSGLSGMGDLIVTCTSVHSRNRRAGLLIGQGMSPKQAMEEVEMVVEGVYTTKAAYHLAKSLHVEMPITEQAYQVLFENVPARNAVQNLMGRTRRRESEDMFKGFIKT